MSDLSLRSLFIRALNSASKASSSQNEAAQDLNNSSLQDLSMLARSIDASGMFSPNETLEDIPTYHLPYLLVEYVLGDVEGRVRTSERTERIQRLKHSQRYTQMFLDRLRQYEIIPEDETKLYSQKLTDYADLTKRRESKVKQFKQEKELRRKLEIIRRNGQPLIAGNSGDDFDLMVSLLPTSDASGQGIDDDDDTMRQAALLVIRLSWARAHTQLESLEQELELLLNAPSPSSVPQPPKPKDEEDTAWRLDLHGGPDGKGPLLDSKGRPLRPFTILPGGPSQRSRFQAEVFRPDHRLPTMTMDEYLEEERRRGNIITGGGLQSQLAPTRSEQLQLDSEMDGTVEGEMQAEQKRQEDENWARYTDLHPKGEGNTMNRG